MSEKKMKYNQFFNEEVRHTSKENPHLLWMLLKLGEKKSIVSWWTEMMNLEDSKAHFQKLHYRSDVEHSPKVFLTQTDENEIFDEEIHIALHRLNSEEATRTDGLCVQLL